MKSQNILILAGAIVVLYLITRKKSTTDTTSSGMPSDTSSTPTSNKVPTFDDLKKVFVRMEAVSKKSGSKGLQSPFDITKWNSLTDKEKIIAYELLDKSTSVMEKYADKINVDPSVVKKLMVEMGDLQKSLSSKYGEALQTVANKIA